MAGFLFPRSLLTLPPRDSILIQAGITNFRHRALVSDRILTARYILPPKWLCFARSPFTITLSPTPSFLFTLFPPFLSLFLPTHPHVSSFPVLHSLFWRSDRKPTKHVSRRVHVHHGLLTLGRAWPRGFSCQGTVEGWNCSFPHEPLSNGFSPMCPCNEKSTSQYRRDFKHSSQSYLSLFHSHQSANSNEIAATRLLSFDRTVR